MEGKTLRLKREFAMMGAKKRPSEATTEHSFKIKDGGLQFIDEMKKKTGEVEEMLYKCSYLK